MSVLQGLLPVDKPPGPTSHDLVAGLRKTLGMKKIGHAGTLDPFASGLLLLLVGPVTRLAELFLPMDKAYEATIRLGVETDTHDLQGRVVAEKGGWERLSPGRVESVLETFRGRVQQRPPAFSAKKVAGEAAHRRVRRGERVELQPVEIVIRELAVEAFEPPELRVALRCSSGTYVRSLARDVGRALGVGGHLTRLRRTSVGSFTLGGALDWASRPEAARVEEALLSPAAATAHLATYRVGADEARRLRQGQALSLPGADLPVDAPVRVLMGQELLAVARYDGSRLKPRRVLMAHG